MKYVEFGPWLQSELGCKVQKISVNAGMTCPNRDGTLGTGGCTFCNNQTFNPAYCRTEKTVTQQLEEGKQFFARKYPAMKYLEAKGFEDVGGEFTYIPNDLKEVTPEQREVINKMVEKMEEFDDVQTVYTNMKPEEE